MTADTFRTVSSVFAAIFISDSIDAGNPATVAPAANSSGLSPYGVWGALGTKSGGESKQLVD